MTNQQLTEQTNLLTQKIVDFINGLSPMQPTTPQCICMMTTSAFNSLFLLFRAAGLDQKQAREKVADILTDAALMFGYPEKNETK